MGSNYLYILISVILFIYLYFEIENKSKEYKCNDAYDDIVVELDGKIIKIDACRITDHVLMLKNNIIALNKRMVKLSDTGVAMLNNALNAASTDLSRFKSDNNFSDVKLQFGSHQDHNILGHKLYNDAALRSDIDDIQYEKYKILNIIMDLEIILLMLQNGNRAGRVRLSSLHGLVRLCASLTNGKPYITYDEIFGIDESSLDGFVINDDNNYNSFYTNDHGVNTRIIQPKVHKIDRSQDIDSGFNTFKLDGEEFVNDTATPVYERALQQMLLPKQELAPSHNTQLLGDSGLTYVIKRNTIDNYVPFCDITKIMEDTKKAKAHLIDANARHCLRDDYKF